MPLKYSILTQKSELYHLSNFWSNWFFWTENQPLAHCVMFCHVQSKNALHNICIEVNFNFFCLLSTHCRWSFCEMHQILQTRNNILRWTFSKILEFFFMNSKSYLFASVMHHSLRVFEHFLSPKLEKVSRISVEFQAVLAILAVRRLQNH